jgi:ferredoxin-NADP reductase
MPLAKPRGLPARLDKKIDVAEGLAIFRIVFDEDFVFKCGQYATLWLTHKGETIPRPYSIASSPSEKRALELYINLVEEGKLTPWLWSPDVLRGLQTGDPETTLSITGPKGSFVLDPADQRDLVFVASGTGLAPFISMIRKLNEDYLNGLETSGTRRIYLVHGVSYSDNFGYRQELEQLASECLSNPARKLGLVYLPTISRPHMDPTWHGLKGRAESLFDDPAPRNSKPLDLDDTVKGMMRALLRPQTHAVYICGHPGTIDNTARILSIRGFALNKDLKFEKYYT